MLATGAGYRSTSPVVAGFAAQTGRACHVSAALLCQTVVAAASEGWDPLLVVGRGRKVLASGEGAASVGAVVRAHNKQLERTVITQRGVGTSAPFHYALVPRFMRQRAAAQLRRYAA